MLCSYWGQGGRVTGAPRGLSLPDWGWGSAHRGMGRCGAWPFSWSCCAFPGASCDAFTCRGVRVSLIRSVQTGSAFLPLPPHHHSLSASNWILSGMWVLRPHVWLWGLHAGQGFQWVLLLTLLWVFSPFFPFFSLFLLLLFLSI